MSIVLAQVVRNQRRKLMGSTIDKKRNKKKYAIKCYPWTRFMWSMPGKWSLIEVPFMILE